MTMLTQDMDVHNMVKLEILVTFKIVLASQSKTGVANI
uniref:Uncharacterized protein n=1 Tax=Arundo donax TaxID=35708 RepID=A0A0A8ZP67_ARUDO